MPPVEGVPRPYGMASWSGTTCDMALLQSPPEGTATLPSLQGIKPYSVRR